jgi:hypothetical protein
MFHIGSYSPNGDRPAEEWPEALGEDAYCGLVGEVVRAIGPHSEADPVAILVSFLVLFGNVIKRGPHFTAGDAVHATNLFAMLVGDTSSGRKGTGTEGPRGVFRVADADWEGRIASGLVSGEGVIHHVRDPRNRRRKAAKDETGDHDGMVEELVDAGVEDKRLMLVVEEMAAVFAVVSRKDNTLSPVLRELWGRGSAQTLAKNSPERCSKALVSLLGHITPAELRNRLDSTEVANGFGNRFLYFLVRRSKLLPRGGNVPRAEVEKLALLLDEAIAHARRLTEVGMADDALLAWDDHYESLVSRPPTLAGALTARAAPQVRRLALLYCLLDERDRIHGEHLRAALEVWRHSEDSVRIIFGGQLGEEVADTCLYFIREAAEVGITRTELRDELGHRISSAKTTTALRLLERLGLAWVAREPTGGRSTERWYFEETVAKSGEKSS